MDSVERPKRSEADTKATVRVPVIGDLVDTTKEVLI